MKRFIVFLIIAILISSFASRSGNKIKNTKDQKEVNSPAYNLAAK